ncbi:MAG: hypothetical protein NZ521_01225, partial [Flammeovirgaceae bacterium]|nr:hypothetical protein [Flammeovirgaceae bacterium]MDW8286741.1 hypothetical protein [Flammeovirgaceae bacterium]
SAQLEEVVVIGQSNPLINNEKTGASINISKEQVATMPTLSRSINDFTRLTPQASGRSFAGADARFNNITIDGSIFNNSFGLSDQPGGRTNQAPISLDAIEDIQVNLAPYDVRQGGFVGAGINAVTRSGTNEISGSVFYNVRTQNLVGKKAAGTNVVVNNFNVSQYGFRAGGPLIKNKLFLFANGEIERQTTPATTFVALRPNLDPTAPNVTRVRASDLDALSKFMREKFNYETGPYEGYDRETKSDKFLVKLDYNINQNHKANLRYSFFNSSTDVLASNSASLGFGNRNLRKDALNFQNSNYIQYEKIISLIGEVNSRLGKNFTNNFIAGYTYQNEDRGSRGSFFPLIEILEGGTNYTTLGFEPFTPNNKLSYQTYQLQNNLTYYANKHTITIGGNLEYFSFRNVFFPGSQSVYVFNSLNDFYTAANAYLENPNLTQSPVSIRRFQLRYSALPGGAEPVQPTKVTYAGAYLQDEFQVLNNLKLTFGLRADVSIFEDTGLENPEVSKMTFKNRGVDYKINTAKLPDPQILWSPRLGFNYDVFDNKKTQVRGGTGLFSGRPAFVWISNQIGNNGVLTGFIQQDNTRTYAFNPDPKKHIPSNPTLPSSYEIAATDPNFKFPQIWRSNLAVDQQLPWGVIATAEFIYSKNVNAVDYVNVNEREATQTFAGPDNRPRYPGLGLTGNAFNNAIRINPAVVNAIVLQNTNKGYSYTATLKLEKPFSNGWNAMIAYNFGVAKDIINPGSIAAGSWNGNFSVRGNNYADLAFSNNDQRHRIIAAASYRKEWSESLGATQITLFWESRNQGRFTYFIAGDMNGDGVNNNDLIYIPRNKEEMNFEEFTSGGVTYTAAQQAEAFEKYIQQDKYLSKRRGQYSERNGALLPWVTQVDVSILHDFYFKVSNKKNVLQLRFDVFNFTNFLNNEWGVGDQVLVRNILTARGVDSTGKPRYRLPIVNGKLPETTFANSASINDVWRAQFGIRYIFN